MNFVLLHPHADDCQGEKYVREGWWDTSWFLSDDVEWRDKMGGRRGKTTKWRVLSCNIHDCPARALIREEVFMVAIEQAYRDSEAPHAQR